MKSGINLNKQNIYPYMTSTLKSFIVAFDKLIFFSMGVNLLITFSLSIDT